MSEKSVAEKLLVKRGQVVFPITPPDDYEQLLGGSGTGARVTTDERALPADAVHLFVRSKDELARSLPRAIAAVRPDGLLWIAYPRVSTGSHDISRSAVHEALRAAGWRPVTQIAMPGEWTAIRARPVEPQGRAA